MAKYHDIYKFVCDRITPDKGSIQRYCDDLGHYYEVLVQLTLKRLKKGFIEFNHVAIDGTIKKAHNSNHDMISKKRNQIISQILPKP